MAVLVAIEIDAQCGSIEEIVKQLKRQLELIRFDYKNEDLLVVLPENFIGYPLSQNDVKDQIKLIAKFNIIETLVLFSKEYDLCIIAGTIPENIQGLYYISTYVFDKGKIIGTYQKKHLFRAVINSTSYNESQIFTKGSKIGVFNTTIGKVGIAICFDLRFSELFLDYQKEQVDIICVPAAFNRVTGEKHWEILLRARAIETQCYIVAAGLSGTTSNGLMCYGHSMIISPDGQILANQTTNNKIGSIAAKFDNNILKLVRERIPLS